MQLCSVRTPTAPGRLSSSPLVGDVRDDLVQIRQRFRGSIVLDLTHGIDRDESVKGVEDKARSEAIKEAAASG